MIPFLILLLINGMALGAIKKEDLVILDGPQGCPNNSSCGELSAKNYASWNQLFLQTSPQKVQAGIKKMARAQGIPLKFYYYEKEHAPPPSPMAIWDSSCSHHQKEHLVIGEEFRKNTHAKNQEIIFAPTLAKHPHEKKILQYLAPIMTTPVQVKDKQLIFINHHLQHAYAYSIDQKGQVHVQNSFNPAETPSDIACPEELVKKFQENSQAKKIYSGYFCKKISGTKAEDFYSVLIPWPCP